MGERDRSARTRVTDHRRTEVVEPKPERRRERRRITVEGIVQGVGFRPFVYGLAARQALAGFVCNDARGVTIEVEGDPAALDAFQRALAQPPALAVVERITWQPVVPKGETVFTIVHSRGDAERRVLVSPDTATCADCLRELFTPADRRFRYPFINCTNCGPRFTIVTDVPYDRERTTMAPFRLCTECQREYEDPADRRFHAQPNACPRCGPTLRLVAGGEPVCTGGKAITAAARLLRQGAIVAVKGLGGYHLACNALDDAAVGQLRRRKHREDKPFALMVPDLAMAQRLCLVSPTEAALLQSRRRPIVLLRRRIPSLVSREVAPGHRDLGIMLPYTPLHHLLLDAVQLPLVMTSGNVSDEPIAYQDADAFARLHAIADAFLVHDRAIHTRCDDSVARVVRGRELLIRRARGYVPEPLTVPTPFAQPLLACGGQLKNTFCLGKGRYAFLSHHIGDLDHYAALQAFHEGIEHFQRLFAIRPTVVAHDLHPSYLSTQYALQLDGMVRIGIQHHHAHIAAAMAEYGLTGPVLGVAFDGSGYGPDGTIWGGEFLIADYRHYERAAHLQTRPLPGGEQAIRQPWRMAATYLDAVYGEATAALDLAFLHRLDTRRWALLRQMLRQGVHCPLTSSVGRLFDAVAALVGLRDVVHYEGQAAVELEMLADESCADAYPWTLEDGVWPLRLRTDEIIQAIVGDLRRGESAARIAAKFHNTVAAATAGLCRILRARGAPGDVVLAGGVFQNTLLLRRLVPQLEALGLRVYVPSKVPLNDGGIALGQAVIANARVLAGDY
jgi:hydrogenase maturation protein HypF